MNPPFNELIALAETDADIARCFPVLAQLRPHLIETEFVERVRRMQREGFLLARLEAEGVVRAVAGFRYHEKLFSGRTLYVDDLVTDDTQRSRGHGRQLLAWLEAQARARGCDLLELDSGVQRAAAHRFYFRERMTIGAYHFSRALQD
ncbi:GNAT family N-acetyltransferase [Horticoccus luteus]|uniref:GNAT family N-acetyltransferase n=1 Tax=Horticoccus luteus TaxID=2862869 RepID=A0A8F9XGK3_9BACT|nr:GNAT family N-acetyltransferase [Horticoccus luteus]QYM79312.1 GNAT family N-acetyltransferase [Horticoccus luteus]